LRTQKSIVVMGSTGSVGSQTLDVVRAFPDRFRVVGLAAHKNVASMEKQIREFRPVIAGLTDHKAAGQLRSRLGRSLPNTRLLSGPEVLSALLSYVPMDTLVMGIVGKAGLEPMFTALQAGLRVAVANKEALVMAGDLLVAVAKKHGGQLVPVDSEHASLAQLLEPLPKEDLSRVLLTASGGPFLGMDREQLKTIQAKDALAHPNWNMGAKVSIDSASMMNKGFELIEAKWLLDFPVDKIDVLIHPESLVHALVELIDGSIMAHMSMTDMRLPIAWALGGRMDLPQRLKGAMPLDLSTLGRLTFRPVDEVAFTALGLCRQAIMLGGGYPAALSVADEVIVDAFLADRVPFSSILAMLTEVMNQYQAFPVDSLEAVLQAGRVGQRLAEQGLRKRGA
jgi:1-deoxy-D-xylulose-5-phosphate reductoisomerase